MVCHSHLLLPQSSTSHPHVLPQSSTSTMSSSSSPWSINYVGRKYTQPSPKVYCSCLSLHSFPPFESGLKSVMGRGKLHLLSSSLSSRVSLAS